MVAFAVRIIMILMLFTSFCEIALHDSSLGKVLRVFFEYLLVFFFLLWNIDDRITLPRENVLLNEKTYLKNSKKCTIFRANY